MSLKRFALKGLLILGITVALCMFFANTIQSITTPKIKLSKPQTGRLEQKISLKAKAFFPSSEQHTLVEAIKNNVIVGEVYVRAGYPVKKGDLVFTGTIPDYDESMKKLKDEFDKKAAELAKKDIDNRKRKKESVRTSRYQLMLSAQNALSSARITARALALSSGKTLSSDMEQWTYAAGDDEALVSAIQGALAAKMAYDESVNAFFETYKRSKLSISSELYTYITERDALIAEMDDLEAQMSALEAARNMLTRVVAERDGYIVSVGVKEGEVYDGKKAAYEMDDPAQPPVLRAALDGVKKTIESGSRATIKGDYDEQTTTVLETGIDETGKRYVDMVLSDELLTARGGLYALISQGELDATLSFRAAQSETLLSSSAVRTENGEDYVYLVETQYGGLTGNHMKLKKKAVTVLDRSDKMIAVADDLANSVVADREDRAIEDGARVMEYID